MHKVRNVFAIDVGEYTNNAVIKRVAFKRAKSIWNQAAQRLLAAKICKLLHSYKAIQQLEGTLKAYARWFSICNMYLVME